MSAAIDILSLSLLAATLDRRAFAAALACLKHVVPKRPSAPALESILVHATHGALTLWATDGDVFAGISMKASVAAPGQMLVAAKRLVEIAKPGAGTITVAHDRIVIGDAIHCIATGDAKDFPVVPEPPREVLASVMQPALAAVLFRTTYAMGTDSTRPHLTALFIERSDGELRFVATDGHRLAKAALPDAGPPFSVLVQRPTVEALERILGLGTGIVRIHATKDRVFFTSDDFYVSGKIADATFPAWSTIVPQRWDARVTIARGALIAALTSMPKGGSIRMASDTSNARVTISSEDADGNSTELALPARFEGKPPLKIGINAKYLCDLVEHLPADDRETTFDLGEELDPVAVRAAHAALAVVMPLRI